MESQNQLQIYNFQNCAIRTIEKDGELWWVAKDVCSLFNDSTPKRSLSRLDDDEKGVAHVSTPGGQQQMTIISEPGLYSLLFYMQPQKSNSQYSERVERRIEQLKASKRWVTHDVLPTIRRHGAYATPQTVERMLADPDTMIATLKALKAERQRTQALIEDNARLLPKATMYDVAIEAEGTMSITEAARQLAQYDRTINRKRLFALLRADGLICKQDNAPTKKAIERGYMVQMMTTRADGKANDPYARMTRKGLDWCVHHYCAEHVVA